MRDSDLHPSRRLLRWRLSLARRCRVRQLDDFQRSHYNLRFQLAFRNKHGSEFQDWFARLARFALGPDFETVRPYGSMGDLKCDGYQVSTRTVFQCYAPDRMKAPALIRKITDDFDGARDHWGQTMRQWVLVHNDQRGLPASAVQHVNGIRSASPEIKIQMWGEPELRLMMERLDLIGLEALFGYAPSQASTDSLGMNDLQPAIDALQRMDPDPGQEPLSPPSADKLERNSLSDEATALLRLGRRKEALVAKYFATDPRPDLGETIAEAFRTHYETLRNTGLSPDEVFCQLQAHAGGNQANIPTRQGAVLAVLSYFFERCDIFEDPERFK